MLALKHATTNTAALTWRSAGVGALSYSGAGSAASVAVDPAVDGGVGLIEVTGLQPGGTYPFTLSLNGTQVYSGALRTMPSAGPIKMAFASCFDYRKDAPSLAPLLERHPDLNACVYLGDVPYTCEPINGTSVTYWGETIKGVEFDDPLNEATTKAQLHNHYRLYWGQRGNREVMESVPCYFVTDDHERPGNDWRGTDIGAIGVGGANYYTEWASNTMQTANMRDWCRSVAHAWYAGNPSNSDAGRDTSYPANKQLYYDFVLGGVHHIFIECCEYGDSVVASDSPPKTQLGATQKAWLLDKLRNSPHSRKVLWSSKAFYGLQDDFSDYPTEQAELVAELGLQSGWAAPGPIPVMTGDTHYPHVRWEPTNNIMSICACPASVSVRTLPDGFSNYIYKGSGWRSSVNDDAAAFLSVGLLTIVDAEWMKVEILDSSALPRWEVWYRSGQIAPVFNRRRQLLG